MPDLREPILDRIETLLANVRGARIFRNSDEINEQMRPCIVLIDGNESASPTSRGRNNQPLVVEMTPNIAIGVSASPDNLGPQVNDLRSQVIGVLANDATLGGLLSENGAIVYAGSNGKLEMGSLPGCDLQMMFTLKYPLKPLELP